jgi:AraC family transcriptional regulator of adaptative response/methylated-DNA-[protein]-cysteine methyltransferase
MNLNADLTSDRMYQGLRDRDPSFDGRFLAGVRSTGIFCRPTCPARTPLAANVEYFGTARDAVLAGYRPCKRCRPLGSDSDPDWLARLLEEVESRPARRWRDRDVVDLGADPIQVREWFTRHHGMTFHGYARARGVSQAFGGKRFEALFGDAVGTPTLVADTVRTPLGNMVAVAGDDGLCLLEFADRRMLRTQIARVRARIAPGVRRARNRWIDQVEVELAEYFDGRRQRFDVPVVAVGTPFQQAVWGALEQIPYGQTRSYGELAREIGRPSAVRAVGKTNGDNRMSIVIPCHRVIGADGSLTGYGGGLWRKERLLTLERGTMA